MARFVLVSDTTLVSDYRNFPLLDFLPTAPSNTVPGLIYNFLKGPSPKPMPNGEAVYSPYSLRKIEAALLQRYSREEVAVPHENSIEKFIDDKTEIIAVSTMDPLGYGPLTMSYAMLFGKDYYPWVKVEWNRLIGRINAARKNKKAKLLVGGPGVWEFSLTPEELDKEGIDYAFQGESEDVIADLFAQLSEGSIDKAKFYNGFLSYDDSFRPSYREHPKFICRNPASRRIFPMLEEIPRIVRPSMKGLVEVMRGCGIGCDFCEVTLRPLRYVPPEVVADEIRVNMSAQGGAAYDNAWLQSDEIFAYKHERFYRPNVEALTELFSTVMAVKGVRRTNPTHGMISIPAAFPELIEKLSGIIKAGPDNWIGIQVGVETGSDRLAGIHMPNKTLPLKIGPDGSWKEIVWNGTRNFNKYYWRPAFTVQTGQRDETDEDNWETVSLINTMSNSVVDGRPFEFTITPMQNVPLGKIKSRDISTEMMSASQIAVYYAAYRHLAKMATRNARKSSNGNLIIKTGMSGAINLGGWVMMKFVEGLAKKRKVDIEKVKRYGLEGRTALKERKYGIDSVQQIEK